MTASPTPLEQLCTAVFYAVTLLASAAVVLMPGIRQLGATKVGVGLLTAGMLVTFLRREMRRKTLGLSVQQIYEQARQGRKFAPRGVELAAVVMWAWAAWLTR